MSIRKAAVILKGYPRLSETFIAQEILELQRRGLKAVLFSLRHPTDNRVHPVHDEIAAPCVYLPEYLYQEPWRVLRSWWHARRLPGYARALSVFLADCRSTMCCCVLKTRTSLSFPNRTPDRFSIWRVTEYRS